VSVSNLYWLHQIQPEQRPSVGDQAVHLSVLAQQGYPVLPGFVVSATMLREFLATINWLEPLFADLANSTLYLNVENARQLQAIAREIRQTIEHAPLPTAWIAQLAAAVQQFGPLIPPGDDLALRLRTSLSLRSLTGPQFASTIVPEAASLLTSQVCWADPESLAIGLKQTWAELFRARNLLYWQRSHIVLPQLNFAVLVQPLIPAAASGSLQIDHEQIAIHVTPGLGMAIERDEVIPDVYHFDRQSHQVQAELLQPQTLVYQVRAHRTALGSAIGLAGPLPEVSPVQTDILNEPPSQPAALATADLAQLRQIAQQLMQDFDLTLRAEWSRCPHLPIAQQLLLTQFTPHTPAILPLLLPKYNSSSRETPADLPPSSDRTSGIIAIGLAAAPGQVTAQATVMTDSQPLAAIPPESILVAKTFTPDWLPLLQQVVGVVAEQGGMTSHGAIIARELGIPAVVGADNSTQRIVTGDWLRLDGDRGHIYRVDAPPRPSSSYPVVGPDRIIPVPPQGANTATQVMVSLSQPEALERAARLPVAGIGLLRSELMVLGFLGQQHPSQWLQQGRRTELVKQWAIHISKFAQAFAPRPVFYRSLDWRSHEFPTLLGAPPTALTMLGVRGTLSYQLSPDLFEVELAALCQVYEAGYTNLRLILPFVRTVEEFSFCRHRVEQTGLLQVPNFELWIMAEVPSALFLLPEYVEAGVQGIAIGTNDLTQLMLGVDRDQSLLASAFDAAHPAVVRAILQLVQTATQLGIPCSICGQTPIQYPQLIAAFVQAGATAITVSSDGVDATLQAIAAAV
jgi:pyruvate, water dikinase